MSYISTDSLRFYCYRHTYKLVICKLMQVKTNIHVTVAKAFYFNNDGYHNKLTE